MRLGGKKPSDPRWVSYSFLIGVFPDTGGGERKRGGKGHLKSNGGIPQIHKTKFLAQASSTFFASERRHLRRRCQTNWGEKGAEGGVERKFGENIQNGVTKPRGQLIEKINSTKLCGPNYSRASRWSGRGKKREGGGWEFKGKVVLWLEDVYEHVAINRKEKVRLDGKGGGCHRGRKGEE